MHAALSISPCSKILASRGDHTISRQQATGHRRIKGAVKIDPLAPQSLLRDITYMDVAATSRQAKALGNWRYATLGAPPKPRRAFPMQAHRPFLGSVPDLSSIDLGREVIIAPRGAPDARCDMT